MLKPWKSTKMTEVLGVTQFAKAPFAKNTVCQKHRLLGKRNHAPRSSKELSLPKEMGGHRGKMPVADMVLLVLKGFLYLPPAWKVSLAAKKVFQMISSYLNHRGT